MPEMPMSEPSPSPETLLAAALEIGDTAEQRAYLDRACGGDAALRAEVESLLAANAAAGEFLLHPAHIGASAAQKTGLLPPLSEVSGTRIGRYKLLEQIGEGGFGVVWMAEQEEPVRRRAALKIIKLGMDTKEVVARFEAERQALAMMDHKSKPVAPPVHSTSRRRQRLRRTAAALPVATSRVPLQANATRRGAGGRPGRVTVPVRLAEAAYQLSGFSGLRTSFQSGMLCTLAVIGGRRAARRRGRRSFRWAEVRGLSFVDGSSPFAGSKGRRSSVVEQPPQGVLIPRQSLAHRFACSERGWVAPSAPGRHSFRNNPCRELAARST